MLSGAGREDWKKIKAQYTMTGNQYLRKILCLSVIRYNSRLPAGGRPALSEPDLAGRIFGDVALELGAPQRLKGPAAPVQCLGPGKISVLATHVAPFDPMGADSGGVSHNLSDPLIS
jgi:hypothetical protein